MKTQQYTFTIIPSLFFMMPSSFLLSQDVPTNSESTVAVNDKGMTDSQRRRQHVDEQIIITWSEKQDELRGFNTKLGDWAVLKLTPQSRLSITSGGTVACVRLDDSLVAYCAELGYWDVIPLPKESTAVATVERDIVTIQEGEHSYFFTASLGRWGSSTDSELTWGERKLSIYANKKRLSEIEFNENDPLLAHRNRQIRVQVRFIGPDKQIDGPEGWYELTIQAGRRSYMDEVIKIYKEIELVPPVLRAADNDSSTAGEKAPAPDQELQAKIASLSEKNDSAR